MAHDPNDPMPPEPLAAAGSRPELLVSAVLHLMSHYTVRRDDGACVKLAAVIERHLKALAGQPDLAPVLRATCQQLAEQWEGVVERALPAPRAAHPLARWIGTGRAGQA